MATGARILAIEDDRVVRHLYAVVLGERGYTVLEADTGDGGLARAQEELPDLIILDMGLPGMHGSQVLTELRAEPDTAAIPVIIVSAWGEGHAADLALKRGAFAVLRKPFDVEVLLAEIERALAG